MQVKKVLLSSLFALAATLPSMANTSQITMSASVQSFLSVQIINSQTGSIVSTDDGVATPSYETLTFGNVDARGLSAGTLAATNGTSLTGVTLNRVLLDSTNKVFTTANPPSAVAGALYYIPGSATTGYSVITNKSAGGTTAVTVASSSSSDIKALADVATNVNTTAGQTVASSSIHNPNGTALSLASAQANNTPLPVTLGLYVENTTTAGSKSATLVFTGT